MTPTVLMSLSPFVTASRRNHVLLFRMCSSKQSLRLTLITQQLRTNTHTQHERGGRGRTNERASEQCDLFLSSLSLSLSFACNNARNRQTRGFGVNVSVQPDSNQTTKISLLPMPPCTRSLLRPLSHTARSVSATNMFEPRSMFELSRVSLLRAAATWPCSDWTAAVEWNAFTNSIAIQHSFEAVVNALASRVKQMKI